MRKLAALLLIVAMPAAAAQSQPLAFTHVTVIDTNGSPPMSDMTVVVDEDRIVAVDKTDQVQLPKAAQVVDASGKFMIPGLWDMHVHSPADKQTREIFLPLTIANGVTGVRHMFGNEDVLKQKADILAGVLLGPHMIVGSPPVDGPDPMWQGSVVVASAVAGREGVRSLKQAGYDFIKVYQFLPREAYFAIADEAKKQNIPFAGHLPFSVSAAEGADAGQKSVEHLFGINLACSIREADLRASHTEAAAKVGKAFPPHIEMFVRNETEPLASFSEEKCEALFKHLAKSGTYFVPTLVLHRSLAWGTDPVFRDDSRLKYMPPDLRKLFDWELGFFPAHRPVYERHLRTIGAMHRAGVKILAGTDTMNAFCFPGFSLHDEMALLVDAGLSPLAALQAATLNPAQYLGLSDQLGTVEKGKRADLVLLEANPLEDIRNTKKIAAVVVDGRYLAKEALQTMLADAEAAANRK
jgi:imidazolonepropionase-like amidohydrolase